MNELFASSVDALVASYDTAKVMALLAFRGDLFLQLWILPGLVMGIGLTIMSVAIRRKSAIEERNGHLVFPKPAELLDGLFIGLSNVVLFPVWVLSWTLAMVLWLANWPFQYLNFAMDSSASWALKDVKKRRVKDNKIAEPTPVGVAPEKLGKVFPDLVDTPVFYTDEELGKIKHVRDMHEVSPKPLIKQSGSETRLIESKRVH